jgi:hypothetical protein
MIMAYSKTVGVGIIALLLVLTMVSETMFHPEFQNTAPSALSSDAEFLEGWDFRKSRNIRGSVGAGVDYQIKINVHYGAGDDVGENVYCASNCESNFSDIRFTDDDGITLLDFWTESYVPSDHAIFWVEVADNLDTDQVIYIYYGNSGATSASNGTATFQFFDDFESGTFDKWDAFTSWSINSTYKTGGEYGAYNDGNVTYPELRHNMNQTENFLISIDARTFENFNTFPFLMYYDTGPGYPCTLGWTNVLYHTGTYNSWPQNSTLTDNTWYTLQIGFDFSNGKIRGWKNDSYMGEVDFVSTTGETPSEVLAFLAVAGTQSTRHLAIDNVFIRKWIGVGEPVEPEPTTTTTSPATTNPTTTTSPTTPTNTTTWNWDDLPDPVVFLITGLGGTILVLVIIVIFIGRQRGL